MLDLFAAEYDMKHQQQGFLMMIALVIIAVFSLLSAALVSMFNSTSTISAYLQATKAASSLAESALEQGRLSLTQPTISSRQTCAALTNTTAIGTGSAIAGKATDTPNSINPRYAFASLTAAITSGSTPSTITVNDSSVFAPFGRVLIGDEVFAYKSIANATTLANVTRAQDSSMSANHVIGEYVSQYQCTISGTGNQPSTNPSGIRQYQQDIQQPVLFTAGSNGTVLRWNSDTSELAWENMTIANASGANIESNHEINDLSILNYHDGWAVNDMFSAKYFNFARLQGNTWTYFNVLDTTDNSNGSASDLYGVSATSASEAWAVGDPTSNNNVNILLWTRNANNASTNWCRLPCGGKTLDSSVTSLATSSSQLSLLAIQTRDTTGDGFADMGYAAGSQSSDGSEDKDKDKDKGKGKGKGKSKGKKGSGSTTTTGIALTYNGTKWSLLSGMPSNNSIGQLLGLDITKNSTSEVFFVGQSSSSSDSSQGRLIRVRNGTWLVTNTRNRMNAVSVIDTNGDGLADFGCAVGDSGQVIIFDGSMATTSFSMSGSPQLNGVIVLSPNDIWAVGNGGSRFHYNGSSWVSIPTGVSTSNNLFEIDAVFPKTSPTSVWYDVIN